MEAQAPCEREHLRSDIAAAGVGSEEETVCEGAWAPLDTALDLHDHKLTAWHVCRRGAGLAGSLQVHQRIVWLRLGDVFLL